MKHYAAQAGYGFSYDGRYGQQYDAPKHGYDQEYVEHQSWPATSYGQHAAHLFERADALAAGGNGPINYEAQLYAAQVAARRRR